ncbi:MAG: twin-arginine translocase subunit TatC [Anaerolineales bacterium]|nr:twin-arginine translocase subunit TatC [Anaerolineales bacterium]MCX7608519.1 twin-arginine translocase subunit TatC [Anaerolineales bacterium]MDW8227565.1 twin-arginine translocase subunit TatC [Anaerolineales bacterium]
MAKVLRAIGRVLTFPFWVVWKLVTFPVHTLRRISAFLNQEPEERDLAEALTVSVERPASLFEHLNEFRKHLFRIFVALVLGVALVSVFTPRLLDLLAAPIGGLDALVAIDVTETVGVFMRVAVFGALVLVSPYIAFEFWLFAAPGLRPRAKKMGLLGIPLVLVFFLGGILFAYRFLLPTALPFLLNFMGVQALPRISSYVNFVSGLLFWIGVAFEFPLVIYVLSLMGLVTPQPLLRGWRIAIILIAILAAVITPTPDPVNMSLVMLPMIVLYFLSIGLSSLAHLRKRSKLEK